MKHDVLKILLSEWLTEGRSAKDAIVEFIKFMSEREYRSLELEFSGLLRSFLNYGADQNDIEATLSIFTSCLKKNDVLLFVDTDIAASKEPTKGSYVLEMDIFAPDKALLLSSKDSLIEDVMKCFGLTGSKDSLIYRTTTQSNRFSKFRSRLKTSPSISEKLFQQLKSDGERAILRELKKRGAVLERDFQELELPMSSDQIRRVLDYFSGDEFRLIERKFAIVCNDTQEIIFLLKSKEQIENAATLQCPKCARQIDAETVMPYYTITDELKALLDGNRWMPLLVQEALIKAGVSKDDILTEVKHSEDEIDVLVFYKGRILVIELKNRPVNLNDAYKLSAKTSRLESVVSKTKDSGNTAVTTELSKLLPQPVRTGRATKAPFSALQSQEVDLIPVVITTHEIAKDAADLLTDTRESTQFLEQSEGKIDEFIFRIIENIDQEDLEQRFKELTFVKRDSIAQLAANQIGKAFQLWNADRTH